MDFICLEARLIVEADGPHHLRDAQSEHDALPGTWLEGQGFRILRVSGDSIVGDIKMALRLVSEALSEDALKNHP